MMTSAMGSCRLGLNVLIKQYKSRKRSGCTDLIPPRLIWYFIYHIGHVQCDTTNRT